MSSATRVCFCTVIIVVLYSFAVPASGMIYYDDATDNTTEDTGTYANSGWDWTGAWSIGSGIAISSKHFITAKHFSIGATFTLGASTYNYSSHVDDPASDLRIVTIQESFSTWADLYTNTDESGKETVMHGRGYTRGAVVTVSAEDKGWEWSSSGSGTMRWGTNTITYIDSSFIGAEFNALAGNEAALADRDSGGGMFIDDGGTWKLAGVNYAVTGPFDYDSDHGSGVFNASIYDKGGLYEQTSSSPETWVFHTDTGTDIPGSSYGTRISSNTAWINSQIPEPATLLLMSSGAGLLIIRRRKRSS